MKLTSGTLTLTTISRAQSFFRGREKSLNAFPIAEKRELLTALENKTTRECEREINKLSPEKPLPFEKTKIITETHSQVVLNFSNELLSIEQFADYLNDKSCPFETAFISY